jgi:hypothetical protein
MDRATICARMLDWKLCIASWSLHTSFGHVMILGKFPCFSFCPLTMASMIDGWSEPRLTKTWVMPACDGSQLKARHWTTGRYPYLPDGFKEGEGSRVFSVPCVSRSMWWEGGHTVAPCRSCVSLRRESQVQDRTNQKIQILPFYGGNPSWRCCCSEEVWVWNSMFCKATGGK